MTRLAIFALVTVIAAFISNSSHANESRKPRENKFQLNSGAISIDTTTVRRKRQDFGSLGRNPPGTVSGGAFDAQESYIQRPSQETTFQGSQQVSQTIYPQTPQPPSPRPLFNNFQNTQRPQIPQHQIFNPKPFQNPASRRPSPRRGNFANNQASLPQDSNGFQAHRATRYYYPPRMPLPLAECFHNPTGYVCCNKFLNDLIVDTYTELESRPKFHNCNINAIALHLQMRAEKRFNSTFETVVSFEDFAQKIHFNGNLACKVEINGRQIHVGLLHSKRRGFPPSRQQLRRSTTTTTIPPHFA
ncbi:hypothetical protein FO519_006550 [Halicephalobus sp. NKZ332]|nr:hypothetical protein FO519_006550 [Halicephalobus sp. NKZ332]